MTLLALSSACHLHVFDFRHNITKKHIQGMHKVGINRSIMEGWSSLSSRSYRVVRESITQSNAAFRSIDVSSVCFH